MFTVLEFCCAGPGGIAGDGVVRDGSMKACFRLIPWTNPFHFMTHLLSRISTRSAYSSVGVRRRLHWLLVGLVAIGALFGGPALGQELTIEVQQEHVPEALECAELHLEAGQEQLLLCVPEEADASWSYRWESERPEALGYLSSANESRPLFRAPQDGAAGLYVYTLSVKDARGRAIHSGRLEVVVHAVDDCEDVVSGPVKRHGAAPDPCDDVDVSPGERIPVVSGAPVADGAIGDTEGDGLPDRMPEIECETHVTLRTGSEAGIACHGHGAAGRMLEYTADFDWPPYRQTQVMDAGAFTFTLRPPQIDAELETRAVMLTARDRSTGQSVSQEVTLTVVNVDPVLQCEDLAVVAGDRVILPCRTTSPEGLPVRLQFLPQVRLDGVPLGVFDAAPEFVAPDVGEETAIEMVVRALQAETNRVVQTSFTLQIVPRESDFVDLARDVVLPQRMAGGADCPGPGPAQHDNRDGFGCRDGAAAVRAGRVPGKRDRIGGLCGERAGYPHRRERD